MRGVYEEFKKRAEKKLQSGPDAGAMLFREVAHLGLAAFEPGAKVVWTTAYCFPMVLYWPFNVVPFDFEYAAMQLTGQRKAGEALSACNRQGYAVDTCTAHRVALGAEKLGFYPRADLLVSTTHFCDGKSKCNEIFKEKFRVPFHLIDVPIERDESALIYVEGQVREVFASLCKLAGRTVDESALVEYIRNHNRAMAILEEVQGLRKEQPSPYLPGNKGYTMGMLGGMLLGRPELVAIYEQFLKELRDAPRERGPDGGERFRLLWLLANPSYPTNIFDTFREYGARIVAEEFTYEFMHPLSENRPLRSITEWILDSRFIRPVEERIQTILKWVEEFHIDGVVSFTHFPCRQGNGALSLIRERLNERGVVFMDLEGDLCDPKTFSPERVRMAIENYMEMMSRL